MTDVGDYTLRHVDYETQLIGPITDTIIDAARLAYEHTQNGFPNWELYRYCIAGDELYMRPLRHWCVALTIAYAETGGVRSDAYSEEMACMAAWDALYMLRYKRQMLPYSETASCLDVPRMTYKRLRDAIYSRLHVSLHDYWQVLCWCYRDARKAEGDNIPREPRTLSLGRGFDDNRIPGSGNFIDPPHAMSDDRH